MGSVSADDMQVFIEYLGLMCILWNSKLVYYTYFTLRLIGVKDSNGCLSTDSSFLWQRETF